MTTKVPGIQAPTQANLLAVAKSIKGILDVREGLIGDKLDAFVTFRDLIDSGLASKKQSAGNSSGVDQVLPPWAENDGYDPLADLSVPPKPENFTATGLFAMVQLQWSRPGNRNHAYTEIWRSNTNVIGNAVLIGTTDTDLYADNLGTGATRYYWARHVSQANIKGPFQAVDGAMASTATDPTYLMDVLTDAYGSTSQAPFFQIDTATVINGVTIPAGTYIKQAFIADATISRAKIQDLAVDNAKIASLDAAKITTGFLSANRIQGNSITADKIDSRNLTIKDSAGNIIFSASGTSYLNVTGLGSLATKNSVSASSDVTGLGTLATKNSVSASTEVTGLGNFAFANKINTGNISAYIDSGAISNAYIGNFISSFNFNGAIDAGGNIINNGTAGWAIGKAGTAVLNNAVIRGEINGGSYAGFAWPSGGGTGFHLGPNGLLLGNFYNGRYLQVGANGDIYAPGFSIVNGSAAFGGTLTADAINAVKTINIEGNAVTIPAAASGIYSASVTVYADVAMPFAVIGTFTQGIPRDAYPWTLSVDGALLQIDTPRSGTLGAMSKLVYVAPGSHTFTMSTSIASGDAFCGIVVLGAKR